MACLRITDDVVYNVGFWDGKAYSIVSATSALHPMDQLENGRDGGEPLTRFLHVSKRDIGQPDIYDNVVLKQCRVFVVWLKNMSSLDLWMIANCLIEHDVVQMVHMNVMDPVLHVYIKADTDTSTVSTLLHFTPDTGYKEI